MENKIREIDKKLEQTEDDEITISLLYQKIELLEDLINEYEVNMNCGRENQNTLRETIKTLQKELEKKDKIIDEMAGYIATLDIEEDICSKTENEHCDKMNFGECEDCIKEYFKNKVEE